VKRRGRRFHSRFAMKLARRATATLALSVLALATAAHAQSALRPALEPPAVEIDAPPVMAPPESFFKMIEERVRNPGRRGGVRFAAEQADVQKPTAEQVTAEMA